VDLSLSPQDQAFRDEVRGFLDAHLTEDLREAGRKTGGVFADFEAGNRWHKALAKRGWAAPAWPKEYGGTGWSATERYIFARECIAADAPRIFSMGLRMVGPVIMKYGTAEQKEKYLPRIVAGDIVFCQGYSEPGSGSDLASLKTRAVRDGTDYVINGTKIWTTGAHVADHMFCLVRTGTEGKPQDGISFVLIDSMQTPGLTVKPIVTLAGDHEVNQVFFDNVRTPIANRIGPENEGWTVAKYLLEFERGGDAYTPNLHARLDDIKRIARDEAADGAGRLIDERSFAERLAEAEMDIAALEMIEMQVLSDLSRGRNPRRGLLVDEDPRQRDPAEARSPGRRGARLVRRPLRARGAPARPQRPHRHAGSRHHGDAALPQQPRIDDLCGLQRDPAQHHRQGGTATLRFFALERNAGTVYPFLSR